MYTARSQSYILGAVPQLLQPNQEPTRMLRQRNVMERLSTINSNSCTTLSSALLPRRHLPAAPRGSISTPFYLRFLPEGLRGRMPSASDQSQALPPLEPLSTLESLTTPHSLKILQSMNILQLLTIL